MTDINTTHLEVGAPVGSSGWVPAPQGDGTPVHGIERPEQGNVHYLGLDNPSNIIPGEALPADRQVADYQGDYPDSDPTPPYGIERPVAPKDPNMLAKLSGAIVDFVVGPDARLGERRANVLARGENGESLQRSHGNPGPVSLRQHGSEGRPTGEQQMVRGIKSLDKRGALNPVPSTVK